MHQRKERCPSEALPTPVCDRHHLDFVFLLELMQPKMHLANRRGRFAPSDFNKSDQRRGLANFSIGMVHVHEVDSRTSLGNLIFSPPTQLATSVCYWSDGCTGGNSGAQRVKFTSQIG